MSLADLFANNYFVRLLRGQTGSYDLIVSMVGVKLGDRLLQIGGGDGRLLAALGAKTGLTGQVVGIEASAEAAEQMKTEATKEGVLSDVHVAPANQLPFGNESFDIVVIPSPAADGTLAGGAEAFRVLRFGGRCAVIARPAGSAASSTIPAQLQQHGFKVARLIAERDGYAFFEAIKK
jgi:ubiquinone/menaquinone biosynthesis C-methylase UbiE